jgi:hypothetical protein
MALDKVLSSFSARTPSGRAYNGTELETTTFSSKVASGWACNMIEVEATVYLSRVVLGWVCNEIEAEATSFSSRQHVIGPMLNSCFLDRWSVRMGHVMGMNHLFFLS